MNGTVFGRFTPGEWFTWATTLADTMVAAIDDDVPPMPAALDAHRALVPFAELLDGQGAEGSEGLWMHAVRVSPDVVLVGIGAEPVAAYSALTRAAFAPNTTIPIGHVGQVLGYLPSSSALLEGGYEAEDSLHWMGIDGRFRPDVQETTVAAMGRLAATLH
jgi:hypothetical protein